MSNTVRINGSFWDVTSINPNLSPDDIFYISCTRNLFIMMTDEQVRFMLKYAKVWNSYEEVWQDNKDFWENEEIFEEAFFEDELNYYYNKDESRIIEFPFS